VEHFGAYKTCIKPSFASLRLPDEPVCLKLKIFYKNTNRTVIYRTCHWESLLNACPDKLKSPDSILEECFACNTDGCNGHLTNQASTCGHFSISLASLAILHAVNMWNRKI
jgi:hypothetical protein